jgi:hypothetical protein
MRILTGLLAIALVVLVAGVVAGSSSQATLTASQAVDQARRDGFTRPTLQGKGSYLCGAQRFDIGPADPTGQYADYRVPSYGLELGDRRVPPDKDNTGRILMLVLVFRDAGFAARCAHAGLYMTEHQPVDSSAFLLGRPTKTYPYRMITPTTVETHWHGREARGQVAGTDGYYETWLSHGRALAFGSAFNAKDAEVLRTDLDRIASQIAR